MNGIFTAYTSSHQRIRRNEMNGIFKLIPAFIVAVFVCIISLWVVSGVLVYKAANEINDRGLGSVLHSVWCGKTPDCKLPRIEK